MKNVTTISGRHAAITGAPNADVIAAAEEILAGAKSGKIQHLAAVYSDGVNPPADLYQGSGEIQHVLALVGGMELCKHTMLMEFYGQYSETPNGRR